MGFWRFCIYPCYFAFEFSIFWQKRHQIANMSSRSLGDLYEEFLSLDTRILSIGDKNLESCLWDHMDNIRSHQNPEKNQSNQSYHEDLEWKCRKKPVEPVFMKDPRPWAQESCQSATGIWNPVLEPTWVISGRAKTLVQWPQGQDSCEPFNKI